MQRFKYLDYFLRYMSKNSLKKGKNEGKKDKEAEFSKIGDVEQVVSNPEPIVDEKNIIYDGKQYSCKIPKNIIKQIAGKDGDKLKFSVLYPEDITKKPELKIEYIRKNGI